MDGFEWQIRHELFIYSKYPCQMYNLTFRDVQTSTHNWFHPSTKRFAKIFLSFLSRTDLELTKPHVDTWIFFRCNQTFLNLMKLSKICSKVIQRTLQSGKNWLRYSSFSAISRVKWKRDQIFQKVSLVKFCQFFPHFGRPPSGALGFGHPKIIS